MLGLWNGLTWAFVETRRIGSLQVSVVGLGCNNFGRRVDENATRSVVEAAIDAGVTFLDTADIYGGTKSEQFLGRALEGRRDQVVLATKFGMPIDHVRAGGADPAYVRRAVEDSLRRLRTDRIDLYQLHEPDEATPIADTLAVLDELVRAGAVREIGCSNFDAKQLREAEEAVRGGATRFVSVQNELSLLEQADLEDGLPEAERLRLAYIPYFPLANGLLTGKYRRGEAAPADSRLGARPERAAEVMTDATFDRLEALERFAQSRGHTLLELAFAWLLAKRPVSSVIAGATKPEQVRANAEAAEWHLTDDDLAQIRHLLGR
jgi:aryl-alcohol dehydrogenase-like predicted oxidoreductase